MFKNSKKNRNRTTVKTGVNHCFCRKQEVGPGPRARKYSRAVSIPAFVFFYFFSRLCFPLFFFKTFFLYNIIKLKIIEAAFKCTHCELQMIKTHLVVRKVVIDFGGHFLAYFEALKASYIHEGIIYFQQERLSTS